MRRTLLLLSCLVTLSALLLAPVGSTQQEATELLPGTAVLISQSGSSVTSGNGGNTSSTSTMTNIFSPPAYVDYKRTGTEPVVKVDRYPFPVPTTPTPGLTLEETIKRGCPGGVVPATTGAPAQCYKDIVYVNATEGFGYPGYDFFWKSETLGQTFRLPHNEPTVGGRALAQGRGGGDGDHAVGSVTHRLFFIDLPFTNITMNVSDDRGDTFRPDETMLLPDAIDDRQWIDVDQTFPGATDSKTGAAIPASPNVYVNYNALLNLPAPTVVLRRSLHDGEFGTFVTDSNCNQVIAQAENPSPGLTGAVGDNVLTRCPDPVDPTLSVAGPVVVDKSTIPGAASHPHRLYIPFLRCTGDAETHGLLDCGPPYRLYVAISDDGGTNWRRRPLCNETTHTGACLGPADNPRNIFVQMTIDRAGNLYYTWAQRPITINQDGDDVGGETDVYYSFSTTGGETWSPAINLTPETNDSAVWPWMVAGDPGQVDLVFYKANCGLNPPTAEGCVWNVYFSQSQNALNTGANFKTVQISDHPNHIGPICLSGLGCDAGRTLGDFFTMDIDHLGAAHVVWADDNNSRGSSLIKYSRQLSGNSVFKNTPINLVNSWPVRDHAAFDPAADVITPTSSKGAAPNCASMDIQQMSATRSGDLLTVNLVLAAPPSALSAATCSISGELPYPADGGFWGVEWRSSDTPNDNYYLAFIDTPGSPAHVEAGRFDNASAPSLLGFEPRFVEPGTLGGTCTSVAPPSPCTLTMTASLSGLGIKPGAGLYSLTGLSLYVTGNTGPVPFTRVEEGFTSLADSTAAIDYNGTGTTTK